MKRINTPAHPEQWTFRGALKVRVELKLTTFLKRSIALTTQPRPGDLGSTAARYPSKNEETKRTLLEAWYSDQMLTHFWSHSKKAAVTIIKTLVARTFRQPYYSRINTSLACVTPFYQHC